MKLLTRIISWIKAVFVSVSVVLFLTCLLATIYYLVSDPSVVKNINTVITFLVELLGGSAIVVTLTKRFKDQLQKAETVSKAITSFLSREPIVVAMLWIFIVIQTITFTYLFPVHSLIIEVKNDPTVLAESNIHVAISPEQVILTDPMEIENAMLFTTSRAYIWGDSLHVQITANGFDDYETNVKWSGFAFVNLMNGYRIPAVNLDSQNHRLQVQAVPENAVIRVKSTGMDTSFIGSGRLVADTDDFVTVEVHADNYRSQSHSFTVSHDTTLTFALNPEPAALFLRAFSEGGIEQKNMTIYINGSETNHRMGNKIILPPGRYNIHLRQEREDSFIFVDEFTVVLNPGQKVSKDDLIVQVKSK